MVDFPFEVNGVSVFESVDGGYVAYHEYNGGRHRLARFGPTANPDVTYHKIAGWTERTYNVAGRTVTVNLKTGEHWDAVTGQEL